ncbi:MAG: hypothetical protein HY885_02835 [Deltaproteobacteria bacterium]|nr:hypothetical protein [Deltaproteobacteria bacterium]
MNDFTGGIYLGGGATTISNSILCNNAPEQVFGQGALAITCSKVMNGYPETGNSNAGPLFALEDDYHLNPESPCIAAGTEPDGPAGDINGDPRPRGAGFDMGADELILR